MITEPELSSGGEPEPERGPDPRGEAGHEPGQDAGLEAGLGDQLATPSRPVGRRQWAWAVGGVAAASVAWVAVLQGTGYGHTAAPDLHGYHITGNPCTGQNLQPLTDALAAQGFIALPASVSKGPALDHVSCDMAGFRPANDHWQTTYTVTFTLDLHKKTDPRAEFEDATKAVLSTLAPAQQYGAGLATAGDDSGTPRPYPGIGDSAYLSSSPTRQSLSVLHGGAVFTLTLQGGNEWHDTGTTSADGSRPLPPVADTSALASRLPTTMRHLMTLMSSTESR